MYAMSFDKASVVSPSQVSEQCQIAAHSIPAWYEGNSNGVLLMVQNTISTIGLATG